MYKRICSFLTIFIVSVLMLSTVSFSYQMDGSDDVIDDEIIYSKDTKPTAKQFLVTITTPEKEKVEGEKSYVICGVSKDKEPESIVVRLLRYDEETNTYIDFPDSEGDTKWELGRFGVLIKEIEFPKDGVNKIRIAAYKKSSGKFHLIRGENLQITDYSVSVKKDDITEKIKNGIIKITDFFKGIFK
ncbi:hypothetical protein [Pseudobacteroides cellulosolvens]|uniref:Uncharacterized protein n=1 Tax=Pseudobacteroides cellulosolvens ATCC 35603 = DSM 2933 TaxID=398512 RepID=A0A0L6JVG4_9FIRM|nr:hypothetical protein [Pseudobacteroides cellulosolvens]KNY29635.1 hypothetical protein Bccel_4909 [Pseudobacteroides cellulosolvens ATCC 35603 = DSM 2933]